MKILIVDDDVELSGLVAFALRQAGYLALLAPDGPSALRLYDREHPDLVVLDVNLPRLDGFAVLERLRSRPERVPIMMLTVRSAEEDQVRALDAGADDYLAKPFSPRTLLARVRALLRRAGSDRSAPTVCGAFEIDAERRSVRVAGGDPIALTRLEFRLLQLLVANAGHALPPERLTRHVWGYPDEGDRQALKQLVHRLRRKLEPDPAHPRYLETVAGAGYALRPH